MIDNGARKTQSAFPRTVTRDMAFLTVPLPLFPLANKILEWPKSLSGCFHKTALVALRCL